MKKIYVRLLLSLIFCSGATAFAQVSYLGLDGGFEGSATIDNVTIATGPLANKWTKANASVTLANETSTVRSGSNSLKASNTATGRRVWSPNITVSSTTSQVTVQFYIRVASLTNSQEQQPGIINNAEGISGTYSTGSAANTWTKITYTKASSTWTTIAGLFLLRSIGSGGDMFVDDMAVYTGAVDNSAPNSPASGATVNNPTTTSLDISWTAASGGTDGGGYIVVRYASNPGVNDDPLVNGIYAVNNTIAGGVNGTVVYRGAGLTFTDAGLSAGTQYWYKVYTYDKAYNYSAEVTGNGTTNAGGIPVVSPSSQTGNVGAAFSYNISATNSPTSYAISTGSLPPGLSLNTATGAITGTPTTVGSYSVDIIATNGAGPSAAVTISFTIGKGTQTISGLAATDTRTYGDANYNLTATATSTLTVAYNSSNPAVATIAGNVVTILSNGTTTITATQAGDGNWNAATPVTQTLTVNPKGLTITGISAANKTYDRLLPTTISGTATLVGVVPADAGNVLLAGSPTANFTTPGAGIGKPVTIAGYSISGSAASKYTLTQPTGLTANIDQLAITLSPASASNKVYDRLNTATITGTLNGVISPDIVTLNGTGTFASINVATGILVTSTATLGGSEGGNYSLTQPTGLAADITPKALTITGAAAQNKVFDGTVAAVITGTLATVISPDVVTLNGTGTFATSAIGTGIAVTSTSTLGGANAANYSLTQPTGLTADITGSKSSDIIFNAASTASTNQNIDYALYQSATITNTGSGAGGSIGVMGITVRDGGATLNDADALPTILTGISFTVTNVANIRSAALFNGNTLISSVAVGGTSPIVFTGLSGANVTCGDNASLALNLRVTFNTTVTDNQKMVFTVSNATTASTSTSSGFAATNAGAAVSENTGGDINRIEVTADRLTFSTVANGSVAINLATFTISAKDALANTDLDRTETVALTTSGTGMTSSTPYTLVAGVVNISNVQFASVQTGITLTGNVTTPALTGTSNSFNISAVTYTLGDYQTNPAFTGTYFFSSITADGSGNYPWQKWTSSGWVDVTLSAEAPQTLAAGSKPPTIYLSGGYIDVAAGSSYNNIVVSGAGTTVFSGNTSTGLTINSGKTLDIKGGDVLMSGRMSLTAGATLHIAANANFYVSSTSGTFLRNATSVIEVEDDGNFYLQSYLANLWTGIEKFHKNSNLYIQEWDNSSTTFLIASSTDVSTYTDGGVTANFGNLIIDMASSSNNQTLQLLPTGYSGYLTNHDLIFNTHATGASFAVRFMNAASYTATIGRNLIVNSTWLTRPVSLLNNDGTVAVTVKGNVENNSSSGAVLRLCSTTTAGSSVALTIEGNLSTSNSGAFVFNAATPGSGTIVATTVNLAGDLSIGAGSNMFNSDVTNAGAVFNFNGTGDGSTAALTQTINIATAASTRNQAINFFVKPGAYAQLINQDMPLGQKSTFTVNGSGSVGGTLDFNFASGVPLNITSYSTGTMFRSEQASTLKITSAAGISSSSTPTTGNVQVTNAPNYTSLATFWYIGRAATQSTGTGLPSSASGKILICDLVDNNAELIMTNPTTITSAATLVASGGKLDIRKGKFIETTSGYIDGSTGTLYMSAGTLYKVVTGYNVATTESGGSGGTYIPRMLGSTVANPYILAAGSTIELSGTGAHAFQTLRGTDGTNRTPYQNIKFSNNNILRTNYKNVSSASVVLGDITIADNAVVDAGVNYLGGNNTTFTMTQNGHYITAGTGVKPDATGAYTLGPNTTIEFNNKSAATLQSPRLINSVPIYANVIISGSNVGLTSLGTGFNSFMQFQTLGSFTVTDTGTFKIANIHGFSGGSNTAISNINNPSITLKAGSTIEYDGLAPDNQIISSALNTFPANAHYQNLVIGGSSDKTAPSGDLIILGNIKKYGASIFKHNGGTVKLNGTTTQNITDSLVTPQIVFNNLEVNNAIGVDVKAAFSVYRTLSFNSVGKLYLNSGDISLKSDVNNTANVGQIDGTAAITYNTGRFIVERFIATNTHSRAWQFLATPTTGSQSINSAWQEGFGGSGTVGISGFGTRINGGTTTNGFDGPTGVNIKSYIPSTDQWTTALTPNSTSAATVNNPNGWMIFVRGDRNNTQTNSSFGNATVLRTRGQLYAPGNVPYVATTQAGKYHAIGNPYASTIDLRTLDTLNITDDIYIWDPTLGAGTFGFGRYRTLAKVGTHYEVTPVGGAYSTAIVNEIQSGQAFFVKARPGQIGTVSFKEANKVQPNKVVTRGGGAPGDNTELLRVQLNTRNSYGEQEVLDGAMAIFGDFSREADWHDGAKFINTGENVGFRVKTILAATERRPSPEVGDTLHIEFSNAKETDYQWAVTTQLMNKPGRSGWIYDRYLKNNTAINLNGETVLNFTVTADPLSAAIDRFKLVFDKIAAPTPVKFISISATRNTDRSINVKWKVENELNITGYTIERSADGRNFTGILSAALNNQGSYGKDDLSPLAQDNYYRIKATGLGGEITYSEVVKVAPLPTKAYISVYPNPVEGKTAQLVFANQPAGTYQVQVINNLGQVIYNGSVKVSGYNFIYPIALGAKTTQGNYEVKVVKGDGKVSVQKIIVN